MAACEESLWQPTNQSINQRRACGRDLFLFLVVVVGFVFDFVFRCGWFVATGELVVFGRGWLLLVRRACERGSGWLLLVGFVFDLVFCRGWLLLVRRACGRGSGDVTWVTGRRPPSPQLILLMTSMTIMTKT